MFDSPGICVTCGYPLTNHPRMGCAALEGNAPPAIPAKDYSVAAEGPAENLRNAQMILGGLRRLLQFSYVTPRDLNEAVGLIEGVSRRLDLALGQLKAGNCGVKHGLPASISNALNSGDGTYRP